MQALAPTASQTWAALVRQHHPNLAPQDFDICVRYCEIQLRENNVTESILKSSLRSATFPTEARQYLLALKQRKDMQVAMQQQLLQAKANQAALQQAQQQNAARAAAMQAVGVAAGAMRQGAGGAAAPLAPTAGPSAAPAPMAPRVVVNAFVDRVVNNTPPELRKYMVNDDRTTCSRSMNAEATRELLRELGVDIDERGVPPANAQKLMSTLQMISDHLMNNTLDMAAKYARLRARAAGESRAVTAGDVAVALDRGFSTTVVPPGGIVREIPEVPRPNEVERQLAAEKRIRDAQITAKRAGAGAGTGGK